jgi:hypothetical protein
MQIKLEQRHVRVCQKWASMRRTIEEAARLLAVRTPDYSDNSEAYEETEHCLWELSEIVATIEAMQMAVRESDNNHQYLNPKGKP